MRRFWLEAGSPRNLAAARIVFAAQALWLLLSRDLASLSGFPAEFWSAVSDSARWRFLLFEGHSMREGALQWLAVAALAGAVLGVFARPCCLLAGLLLYHLAPLETIVVDPSPWLKGFTLSSLALVVLSLSPCADALRLWRRRRGEAEGWEYGWPVRLLQFLVAQLYFFGAYAKLFQSGLAWASPANMRAWMLLANQDPQLTVFHLGLVVAAHPALCALAGAAGLGVDLAMMAAFLSRKARRWIVPATVLFHLGILLTMNYAFLNLPQLLVFVDWGGGPGARPVDPRPSGPVPSADPMAPVPA